MSTGPIMTATVIVAKVEDDSSATSQCRDSEPLAIAIPLWRTVVIDARGGSHCGGPEGYSGARHTAQAATAEPSAMTKYPATHPDGLAAPPNQSSTFPTATGPRKPVVNPASAYKASAAPRCAGSAAATAPPASAPTSAKLVICTRISSGRTIQIEPPAVADKARHVATEIRQMPITAGRRPRRAATSAIC